MLPVLVCLSVCLCACIGVSTVSFVCPLCLLVLLFVLLFALMFVLAAVCSGIVGPFEGLYCVALGAVSPAATTTAPHCLRRSLADPSTTTNNTPPPDTFAHATSDVVAFAHCLSLLSVAYYSLFFGCGVVWVCLSSAYDTRCEYTATHTHTDNPPPLAASPSPFAGSLRFVSFVISPSPFSAFILSLYTDCTPTAHTKHTHYTHTSPR